ncbi:MAG TPA: tRNA1(Val) (adenine(37)-N6)-methyltransferase [Geothermobacteraceae bacterium]|nr:tRNA1(Val) (adenine(37)-N6)-methyltransferase [Geothermobacteraceae bacterium]
MKAFGLQFQQATDGYRFSIDPFLLCGFCRVGAGDKVIDLGTGAGVIPLLLAVRYDPQECVGVEIQPQAAALARRNCVLNRLEEQIRIVEGDVCRHRELFLPQSADVVVANPPYRIQYTGKTAPDPGRATARHELAGTLEDFVAAAAYLLKNGGRCYVIYLAERLADLLTTLRHKNIESKRLRLVHSRAGDPAKLVMVEGRRAGKPGLKIEPPLYIYEGDHYTEDVLACYGEGGD